MCPFLNGFQYLIFLKMSLPTLFLDFFLSAHLNVTEYKQQVVFFLKEFYAQSCECGKEDSLDLLLYPVIICTSQCAVKV